MFAGSLKSPLLEKGSGGQTWDLLQISWMLAFMACRVFGRLTALIHEPNPENPSPEP